MAAAILDPPSNPSPRSTTFFWGIRSAASLFFGQPSGESLSRLADQHLLENVHLQCINPNDKNAGSVAFSWQACSIIRCAQTEAHRKADPVAGVVRFLRQKVERPVIASDPGFGDIQGTKLVGSLHRDFLDAPLVLGQTSAVVPNPAACRSPGRWSPQRMISPAHRSPG